MNTNKSHYDTLDASNISLVSPKIRKNPFPFYKMLRERFPIVKIEKNNLWTISRYNDVLSVLKQPDIYSSVNAQSLLQPSWIDNSSTIREYMLAFEDNPKHAEHRSMIGQYFSRSSVELLSPHIRSIASDLIINIKQNTTLDFLQDFSLPYVEAITARIIGLKNKEAIKPLWKWVDLIDCPPSTHDPLYLDQIKKEQNVAMCFFKELIEKDEWDYEHCLINSIKTTHKNQHIDDGFLTEIIELISLASMQPARHLLNHAIIQLSKRPTLLADLVKNPSLTDAFVEELMRRNSHEHFIGRITRTDTTLSGVRIPKNSPVILIVAAANRDSAQFQSPDKFDIFRPNIKSHLALGWGVHRCLGASLAKMQITLALETIFSHFSKIEIPPSETLLWHYSFTSHAVDRLPVQFS